MITSIERKVSIKKDNRVIHDKVSLASKYGYISSNIIKTIDNSIREKAKKFEVFVFFEFLQKSKPSLFWELTILLFFSIPPNTHKLLRFYYFPYFCINY